MLIAKRGLNSLRKGSLYNFRRGKLSRRIDRKLSQQVARKVKARASQCYHNAWLALQHLRELDGGEYVEGHAVTDGRVIEHGWNELDGRVVDPTFPAGCVAYFAGLRFDRDAARANLNDSPELPIFFREDSPEFRESYVAACEFSAAEKLQAQRRSHHEAA